MVTTVDIKGKINNMHLNKSDALLPFFEAVVNSIQAINERKKRYPLSKTKGNIKIYIHRSETVKGQQEINKDSKSLPPITGFTVEDNGIGFDEYNYSSFNRSDSTYKINIGCKGVGHWSWLKVFDEVSIYSVFEENGCNHLRTFDFIIDEEHNKNTGENTSQTDEEVHTIIELKGFKKEFRQELRAYKRGEKIAEKILYHCLEYYVTESSPEIIVYDNDCLKDGEDEKIINLNDIYESIKTDISKEKIKIKEHKFELVHVKLKKTDAEYHRICLCGNNRCVTETSLNKYLGKKPLSNGKSSFIYCVYVSSSYLDESVNTERNGFTIPDKRILNEDNVSNLSIGCPSIDDIENTVISASKAYLKDYLDKINEEKRRIVLDYISTVNPSMRFVYNAFQKEILDEISIGMSNSQISNVLYKYKGLAENQALTSAKEALSSSIKDVAEINLTLDEAIEKLDPITKNGLAGYVLYRYRLLELMQKKLLLNKEGKYHYESEIHNIIYPKKESSDKKQLKDHNLWILDDRLAFHSFATSENPFNKFTNSDSKDRPDIILFNETNENGIATYVTIVELKRPSRPDGNIVSQIYGYLDILKSNSVKTKLGDTIYTNDNTIYYCYAICDFENSTSDIMKTVMQGDYRELIGELGYYTYNKNYNAHIEIIAYKKLLSDAIKRNRVWFDKLNLNADDLL